MKRIINKRTLKTGSFIILCILLLALLNTGCCTIARKIGEQAVRQQLQDNTSTSFDVPDAGKTPETETSSETTSGESTTSKLTSSIKGELAAESATSYESNNENGILVNFNMEYDFSVSGNISLIDFAVIVPEDYKNRQDIISADYSIQPIREFKDGTNSYAEFEINNPSSDFEIKISDEIMLYQYGLETARMAENSNIDAEDIASYTAEEKYLEKSDEAIIETAARFNAADNYSMVESIYNYVMDNMEWVSYVPEDVGAKAALIEKTGDCTSYSDLFIALLRAKGIPARMAEGYTVNASSINEGHNWVEVYFDDTGWVPFDPTFDDNNGSTSLFQKLDNIYVYMSLKRNDLILDGFHFYAYRWYGDGKVDVTKNITVN